MTLLDGRDLAAQIRETVSQDAAALLAQDVVPTLGILVPTNDEGTAWYVRSLAKAADKVGIDTRRVDLDQPTGEEIGKALCALSADQSVHGVICQTPLPEGLSMDAFGRKIPITKDVDGANPASLGRVASGMGAFAPATAQAVVELLHHHAVALTGARVTVVGRSTVVGTPAALLLVRENATVTVCHSRTKDLAERTRDGEVVVVAIGKPHLLGVDHFQPGAVVIDVGTNPTPDGGLVGDVDTVAVEPCVSITPVPGGVGPVTTAVLLRNTVQAARDLQEQAK